MNFVTFGHSDRSPEAVIEMLREATVDLVADVRAFPRSRANPAFNIDQFPDFLSSFGMGYQHFPDLGGRRTRQSSVNEAINAFWRVKGFHNYADYALGEAFKTSLQKLERLGRDTIVALMCSEAVWWRCHRRILSDYLLAHGHQVVHLMGRNREQQAVLSDGAVIRSDGHVVYPKRTD